MFEGPWRGRRRGQQDVSGLRAGCPVTDVCWGDCGSRGAGYPGSRRVPAPRSPARVPFLPTWGPLSLGVPRAG